MTDGAVGSGTWFGICLQLVNFRDTQFAHCVIWPKAEMPIADEQMLHLSAGLVFGCVIPELPGMFRQLVCQHNHRALLYLGETDEK